jgi:hypothetical protein
MADDDAIMSRIIEAIALSHGGDRDGARSRLGALWEEIAPDGDPFHRCTLAHYMADVQEDPRDELWWDLRALEAAGSLTDERVKRHHPSMALRAFYPSLHLNLAEDYRRLGALDSAREHLSRARQSADALPEDGYGTMIRRGIARLSDELAGGAGEGAG